MNNTCTHTEDTDLQTCTDCQTSFCDDCGKGWTCPECDDILCEDCGQGSLCNYCEADTVKCAACGGNASIEHGTMVGDEYVCDDSCAEHLEEQHAEEEQEKADLESAIQQLELTPEQQKQVRENFRTGGRASRNLWQSIQEDGDTDGLLEAIGVAHERHNDTEYDNIDKRGMSEDQVADLRRMANRGEL